jgi:prepilin-type N-terminal cleavage/methylation domain-containing protein
MLKKLKQSKSEGFTIIEVMIVLAIAGLIILIVLLAVPALQRNGRNTAIKNDAAAVAGGITEFSSNNDGVAPTSIAGTGTVDISGAGGTSPTQAKVQGNTMISTIPVTGGAPSAGTPAPGNIAVWLGHKCGGGGSSRATAIYYSIENNTNTPQQRCLDA